MIVRMATDHGKGWFTGPWESAVPAALGYADVALNESHVHDSMFEAYLVARGHSTAIVAGREVDLAFGDMLVVEPGENHSFLSCSGDYFHFVVQAPFVSGDKRIGPPQR